MADNQQPAEHRHYDPLTSMGKKSKGGGGFAMAVTIAFILHGLLGLYLWKVKFEPQYKEYSDDATKVDIIKPPPPPITLIVPSEATSIEV